MSSGRRRARHEHRQAARRPDAAPPQAVPTARAFLAPLALTGGLLLLSLAPRVAQHAVLLRAFWSAALVLLIWQIALFLAFRSVSQAPSLLLAPPRRQHYIQAAVQLSVFVYWGWYWPPVYEYAPLLLAQLLFAYAFDMLLGWTRRGGYLLGFGPFPIIFSTNLFLWFRDDWFYLQFLMVAVGFLGKEIVRWHRDGRRVHIFNPSAFSLGLFSVVLIATGTSDLTWGQEIASTLSIGPRIYLFLFLGGLVVMYFFSITLVAASAAAVLFGASALYAAWSGVPYFLDSEIPTAVFLGLHLLVTDPSTSPRTPLGKTIFGVLYGVGVFALYALLGLLGAPTFYDKLLCVPLLNLSVPLLDRLARSVRYTPSWSHWGAEGVPARMNLTCIALWIAFFGVMTATGRTDGRHTGDSLPFWERACEAGRPGACDRLLQLEYAYCADNAGWACNEIGAHLAEGRIVAANPELALAYFSRACELRFQVGCLNLLAGDEVRRAPPRTLDLRLLLREGGRNLVDMSERDLIARACDHDWVFACGALAAARQP